MLELVDSILFKNGKMIDVVNNPIEIAITILNDNVPCIINSALPVKITVFENSKCSIFCSRLILITSDSFSSNIAVILFENKLNDVNKIGNKIKFISNLLSINILKIDPIRQDEIIKMVMVECKFENDR